MRAKLIYEKFIEESDPIADMGIGIKLKIEEWLKTYRIKNYILNDDMTIDVNGYVNLSKLLKENLPDYIQFGNITNGFFSIDECNLTSLRGVPFSINKGNTAFAGDFSCRNNKLTSLKYAPKNITGKFYCYNNAKTFTIKEVLKYCKVQENNIYV